MSSVVGLHGQDVPNLSLAERATEAKVALRKLLAAVEAGEFAIDQWLFVYDLQCPEGRVSTRSLDSDLTVTDAVYLANAFIFDTMLKVRDMT